MFQPYWMRDLGAVEGNGLPNLLITARQEIFRVQKSRNLQIHFGIRCFHPMRVSLLSSVCF